MTPLSLIEALVEECGRAFVHRPYKGGDERIIRPNIYKHELPAGISADDPAHFPFIVVRFTTATQSEATAPLVCTVVFICGVYDDTEDYQGYSDAMTMMERLRQWIFSRGVIEERYTAQHPYTLQLSDESAYPYYFSTLECSFDITGITEQEALLNGII